jgi:HlyD family secretion protein
VKSLLRKLPILVGAAALVSAIVYAFLPAAVSVDTAVVGRGPLRVTADEDGKTRVRERYVVAAPLAGKLLRINLKAGDPVRKSEPLAIIEPTDPGLLDERERARAEAAVKAAEATREQAASRLERARREEENARKELARGESLAAIRGISLQELDTYRHRVLVATEEIRAARFAVRVAEFELEQAQAVLLRSRQLSPGEAAAWRFVLPSPVDGRVLRVNQESLTPVTPGLKLIEVGDPHDLEVEVDLLSADAVKVKKGARVFLEHWGGGEPLLGQVRVVEPSGFTKVSALGVEEQRVNVIVDIDDPPERRPSLGDGYRVEARVVVWEKDDVLKVPAGALFRHGGGWAVFVVAGGKAELRPVEVGQNNGLEAEVLGGLQEGEGVVVHPGDKVKDGVAVTPR